jgi:NAD+ kinase
MKRFDIIVRNDSKSQLIAEEIKSKLIENGCEYSPLDAELIVCVGGDGTLLNAFHDNIHSLDRLKFVGIHTGTLGFSTDYTVNEIDQLVEDISTKEPVIDHKAVLQVECFNGEKNHTFYALNEIRVENIVKTQAIDVYINDDYFESFRGNGICVSGQHGSTAYNRSIGGAVLYPGLDLLQMTEISGIHHRHSRSLGAPLIMNSDALISLRNETFKHALLCYDHLHIHLDLIQRIDIYNSTKTMQFARYRSIPHLKRLCSLF